MTTLKDRQRQASDLADQLKDVGIPAVPYKKGPISNTTFALGRDAKGRIRTWVGNASVEQIARSDKLHQTVLHMWEDKRTFQTSIKLSLYGHGTIKEAWDKLSKTEQRRRIRNSLTLSANGLRIKSWTPTSIKKRPRSYSDTTLVDYVNNFKVECWAPKHESHFLVGIDEVASFICELPKPVTSIAGAIESLRPDDLRPKSVRQGEWFFEPVTSEEMNEITAHFAKKKDITAGGIWEGRKPDYFQDWTESHTGICVAIRVNDKTSSFAIGPIMDRRQGQHKTLMLNNWHRVRRNMEVPAPRNTRNWD